jgi:hypothetical protein
MERANALMVQMKTHSIVQLASVLRSFSCVGTVGASSDRGSAMMWMTAGTRVTRRDAPKLKSAQREHSHAQTDIALMQQRSVMATTTAMTPVCQMRATQHAPTFQSTAEGQREDVPTLTFALTLPTSVMDTMTAETMLMRISSSVIRHNVAPFTCDVRVVDASPRHGSVMVTMTVEMVGMSLMRIAQRAGVDVWGVTCSVVGTGSVLTEHSFAMERTTAGMGLTNTQITPVGPEPVERMSSTALPMENWDGTSAFHRHGSAIENSTAKMVRTRIHQGAM